MGQAVLDKRGSVVKWYTLVHTGVQTYTQVHLKCNAS